MKRFIMTIVLAAGIMSVVAETVMGADTLSLAAAQMGQKDIVSGNNQTTLVQAGAPRTALSDADKKALDSQLQKFQTEFKKKNNLSTQTTPASLKDLIQLQRELNRKNADSGRLNQSPANHDVVGR
jgi:hypothetical protein